MIGRGWLAGLSFALGDENTARNSTAGGSRLVASWCRAHGGLRVLRWLRATTSCWLRSRSWLGTSRLRTTISTLGAAANGRAICCAKLVDISSRVREQRVNTFFGVASSVTGIEIGNKHIGQAIHEALSAGRSGNSERSAVHVHLSVANLVEPSPGKSVVTSRKFLGDIKVVCERAGAIGICREVPWSVFGRAATFNGFDYLPNGVLGGLQVSGDRNLARTTTMYGAANEFQCLLAALGVDIAGTSDSRVGALARKIGAITFEGAVVDLRIVIRHGVCHFHVGTGRGDQAGEYDLLEHFE